MVACADQELLLGGLVDNELDAANVAMVEAHVLRCEGCREELERLQALHNLMRSDGVRHAAPDSLRQRIGAMPELSPRAANENRLPAWLAPGLGGAIAASLAMVTFLPATGQAALEQQLVSSHVRSLQPGHLIDVQTANQHVVKPWFNGKVDFAPPVPDLSDRGFPLVGGRLDSIDGKTAAAIVYKRRLHTVNVYVWRASAARGRNKVENGFALDQWSTDGLRFAAISDIPSAELRQFENLYRQRSDTAGR
ncbi:anti-sigma factor family protein [Sphingomonas alba]|uniref:Zf-HC2 domain-containing protein n=1 Tax=Sphingomonas alba TaxID=2908208 RepID=A0ABT0RM65_9SPHN|nr:zf-HC2 domain-containing protein [Sphingomonas alba]MCL6683734.1 zf-HC2 domain-containing protein [Sphingomonas alba]